MASYGPQGRRQGAGWLSQMMTGASQLARSGRSRRDPARPQHPQGASFEMANSLNRERQSLSNTVPRLPRPTFANLNRPELAGEILEHPHSPDQVETPGLAAATGSTGKDPVSRRWPRPGRDHGAGEPGHGAGSAPARRARARSTGCMLTGPATAGDPTMPRARCLPLWGWLTRGPRTPIAGTG